MIRERIRVNTMLMAMRTVKMTAQCSRAFTSLLGTATSNTHSMILGVYRLAMEARMLSPRARSICVRWRRTY